MKEFGLDSLADRAALWLMTSGLRLLAMALVLLLFLKVVSLIGRRIIRYVEDEDPTTKNEREKRAETLVRILNATARVIGVIVMLFVLLRELGVNVAPLIAGAGVAGIAIGFGAQSLVKDVFTGFFILLENQFRVGDVIKVGGVTGLVEEINLRLTILRDLDGARHYIPNSQIGIVSNMTIHWSRVVIDAGVSYDADLNAVEREMKAAAAGMKADTVFGPMMIEDAEYLGVESFGNSAVNVRILIKTRPQMQWNVAREYRKRMKAAFDAAGIEIPFPQIVVHQAGK